MHFRRTTQSFTMRHPSCTPYYTLKENHVPLIMEVEKNSCLYDPTHPKSKDRKNADVIWNKIGVNLKESGLYCKNKWRTIRCNYMRSLNKPRSNINNDNRREYYLTPHLQFLSPFISKIKQEMINPYLPITYSYGWLNNNGLHQQNSIKQEYEPLETKYTIPTSNTVKIEKGTRRDAIHHYKKLIESLKVNQKKQEDISVMDDSTMFLLSLIPHVKTMTAEEQLTFERGIAELIMKIKYSSLLE